MLLRQGSTPVSESRTDGETGEDKDPKRDLVDLQC
jgi:hypothetical protein